jgi:hypothetical protein
MPTAASMHFRHGMLQLLVCVVRARRMKPHRRHDNAHLGPRLLPSPRCGGRGGSRSCLCGTGTSLGSRGVCELRRASSLTVGAAVSAVAARGVRAAALVGALSVSFPTPTSAAKSPRWPCCCPRRSGVLPQLPASPSFHVPTSLFTILPPSMLFVGANSLVMLGKNLFFFQFGREWRA